MGYSRQMSCDLKKGKLVNGSKRRLAKAGYLYTSCRREAFLRDKSEVGFIKLSYKIIKTGGENFAASFYVFMCTEKDGIYKLGTI